MAGKHRAAVDPTISPESGAKRARDGSAHWLTSNRLSVFIVIATAMVWLALWLICLNYADRGNHPFRGTLIWENVRSWRLTDLPREAQLTAYIRFLQSFVLALGVAWLAIMRDEVMRWVMGPDAFARLSHPRSLQCLCGILITLAFCILLARGAFHDYGFHIRLWELVMVGEDPWRAPYKWNNTFGPAFNLFAPAAVFSPFLPMVIFIYVWFGCWLLILGRLLDRADLEPETALARSALLVLGPYFWVLLVFYTHFDIVPAATALIAVHWTMLGRPSAAGAALGFGVLLKFYPIVVLPFLMVRDRRLDWRPAVACILVVATGFGIAAALWGESVLDPVLRGATPQDRHLSIFRALDGRVVEFLVGHTINASEFGLPLTAVSGFALFLYCYWKRIDLQISAALAPVVVLMLYPRANHQYFAICFLLIAYWYATDRHDLFRSAALRWSTIAYLGWVSAFSMAYYLSIGHLREHPADWVRDVAGGPALIFAAVLVVVALREASRTRRQRRGTGIPQTAREQGESIEAAANGKGS